ncbi:MAG: FecR domain-containing protein [Chitinophagaceae bacterium]|nr:FecR domain-containing protein [Chitinophagaceae bacterium]
MTEELLTALRAYLNGESLSEDQAAVLEQWCKRSGYNLDALRLLEDKDFVKRSIRQMEAYTTSQEAGWDKLMQTVKQVERPGAAVVPIHQPSFLRKWGWVAAAVVVLLGTGVYMVRKSSRDETRLMAGTRFLRDIPPGRSGAILTLSDGRQMVLDSMGNGVIATQGNVHVLLKDGQVSYDKHADARAPEVAYNTMTTPRGRQYKLVLPDGTKVWLNAASKLIFPTVFNGDERKVEVTGEAYFEVAKDVRKPFRVKVSNDMEIEVLGTSFNVCAYSDEASINTTLLEGSVRVAAHSVRGNGGEKMVISPGEQAQVYKEGMKVMKDVNVEQVVAWKSGVFSFIDADLPSVMRQLSRWYNVEVSYAGTVPDRAFTGEIGRTLTLDQVLRILARNKIAYKIEGDSRIIILP